MRKPSLNAYKGYTYQQAVYMLFVAIMDVSRKINRIKAEIITEHNFDDIYIYLKDFSSIYVQTKNYDNIRKLEILEDKVVINDNESVISNSGKNIFVVNNYKIQPNSNVLGIPSYEENSVHIIALTIENIFEMLDKIYDGSTARINQIIKLALDKSTKNDNEVDLEDLPEFYFFSNKLLNDTHKIREFTFDTNKKTIFIIGKPGVGKSHLVNELSFPNKILYRFWISEDDKDKSDRLLFDNFFKQICISVFGNMNKHTIEELLDELANNKQILVLDGLDHIENYNHSELDKYFNLIEKVNEHVGVKQIILTRPLVKEIKCNDIIELDNWSMDETISFLEECHEISDYIIKRKIYEKTKGYPIITDYLARHYKLKGELLSLNSIDDISTYYKELTKNIKVAKSLTIFALTRSYITKQELKIIFGIATAELLENFIMDYPYLFKITLNRINLIHDSFNTYLIKEVGISDEMRENFDKYVMKSISKFEIRFLSRIDSLSLSSDFKRGIIKKYLNFDTFLALISQNIDYETIKYFYSRIGIFIEQNRGLLNIYQYYDYILIENLVSRDNIEQQHAFIYQLINYLNSNGFSDDDLFSSGILYGLYNIVNNKDFTDYKRYIQDRAYKVDDVMYELVDEFESENKFFDILNDKITEKELKKFEEENIIGKIEHEKQHAFTKLLVLSYINDIDNCYNKILKMFINGNKEVATIKLTQIFKSNNVRGFMARWSLNEALTMLYELGLERTSNDYINLSLHEFIQKYSIEGSFNVAERITAYIRLANKEKRKIDITSISEYFTMYYRRKDYTGLTIGTALDIFQRKKLITLEDSCKCIVNLKDMSEKGIHHIFTEFINRLSESNVVEVQSLGYFDIEYNICINDLDVNNINLIKYPLVHREICNLIARNYRLNKNDDFSIDYNKINNIIESKYKDEITNVLKMYNIVIVDVPEIANISYQKIKYKEQDNEDKEGYKTPSEKGYVSLDDYNYIKNNNVGYRELAKFQNGWYYCLPYPSLFDSYDKSKLREDMLEILFDILFDTKDKYGRHGGIELTIGNVLELLYNIEFELEWERLFRSFKCFLYCSQIKFE